MARRIIAFVLPIVLASAQSARAATEVNTCGQAFSGAGFLSSDLDCSGFSGDAIVLNGGSLDLRGFTLTGGNASAIYCSRGCKVVSSSDGGQIVGAAYFGINGDAADLVPGTAAIRVENVSVSGNVLGQIKAIGNITVVDSTIADTAPNIALDGIRVRVVNSTVSNSGLAIFSEGAKVIDSQIVDCASACIQNTFNSVLLKRATISGAVIVGVSVLGDRVRILDSTISDGVGAGIWAAQTVPIRVVGSTISNNGGDGIRGAPNQLAVTNSDVSGNGLDGIHVTGAVKILDSTVTANGRSGIDTEGSMFSTCGPVRLLNTVVAGNGTDGAACGVTETCADLATCGEPAMLLDGSTCETSYDTNSGFPGTNWGLCALD